MDIVEIKAEPRETKGKGNSRKMRRRGLIPAIMYSKGKTTQMLSIDGSKFSYLYEKGLKENRFLKIQFGKKSKSIDALLKEIQVDPVSEEILHLDLYEVDVTKVIDIEVPIKIINEDICMGLQEDGALITIHARELNINALPFSVPKDIEVDVKDLEVGDSLLIKDMPVIEGLRYNDEPETKVVSLNIRKMVEEVEEVEEAEEGAEEKAEGTEDKEKDEKSEVKAPDTKDEKKEA